MGLSPGQLNFFKIATLVHEVVRDALQEVLHSTWANLLDPSVDHQDCDKAPVAVNKGPAKNGIKTEYLHCDKSCKEWDCSALINAILFSRVAAKSCKCGKQCPLYEFVQPLPSGMIHDVDQRPTGNPTETLATAVDQLRLLHNAVCHVAHTKTIDKKTFDSHVTVAKDALIALGQDTSDIDDILNLSEEDFSADKLQDLENRLQKEECRAIELKQINNPTNDLEPEAENKTLAGRPDGVGFVVHLIQKVDSVMQKTDDKIKDLNNLNAYLEKLDVDSGSSTSKNVYCSFKSLWMADIPISVVLIFEQNSSANGKGLNISDMDAPNKSEASKSKDANVILYSPSSANGKKLLLLWKTCRTFKVEELQFVESSLRENVKLLLLQPNVKEQWAEGQDFYVEFTMPTDTSAKFTLHNLIDYFPLFAEQELSQSIKECANIDCVDVTTSPFGHVSCLTYKLPSPPQADCAFYYLVFHLDKKLPLIRLQDIVVRSSYSEQNAGFFFSQEPSCSRSFLSVVSEKDVVTVKWRTLESNCICSSIREAVDNMVASAQHIPTLHMKSRSQLPCEESGNSTPNEDFSYPNLPSGSKSSCAFASGKDIVTGVEGEPSVAVLHVKDGVLVQHADHSDDQQQTTTESPWCFLECPLVDGYLQETLNVQGSSGVEIDSTCIDDEQLNASFLSTDSASSLNSYPPSPCDDSRRTPGFSPKRSSSVAKDVCMPSTEVTYSGKCANAEPFSDSSAKSQADHVWMSSSGEGLLPKEDFPDTETREGVSLEGTLERRDQDYNQQKQVNCTSTCANNEQSTIDLSEIDGNPEPLSDSTIASNSFVSQFRDEIVFLQDLCCKQREQISQLEERLKQIELEKQDLQGEVGRQLFLESKEKRRSEKILQPFREYGGEQSMPGRASADYYDFPPMDRSLPSGAGPSQQSGKPQSPSLTDSSSPQEGNHLVIWPNRCHDGNEKTLTTVQSTEENKRVTEVHQQILSCSTSSGNSVNIEGDHDIVAFTANTGFNDSSLQSESSSAEYACFPDTSSGGSSSESSSSGSNLSQSSASSAVGAQHFSVYGNSSSFTSQDESDGTTRAMLNCRHFALETGESSSESAFAVTSNVGEIHKSSVSKIASNGGHESGDVSGAYAASNENNAEISDLSVGSSDGPVKPSHLDPHLCPDDVVESSGEEIQERHVSSFPANEECDSRDVTGACAVKDAKDEEISDYSISHCDGAVKSPCCNHQSGAFDVPDGPVCSPAGAQGSLNSEHSGGVKKDALTDGDATEKHNSSCVRKRGQKDTFVDQSDSNLNHQTNKWENSGARPRDRPRKEQISSANALPYCSLVDLVPQEVAGPMAHGVMDIFLARHSEDKHLHESLYYSNTENMLEENPSFQGASYLDGMMNLNDSNKAKTYFGDCQAAARPDPYYTSHFPILPRTGRAYERSNGEVSHPYYHNLNGSSGLLPGNGSSSSNSDFSVLDTDMVRSDSALGAIGPRIPQDGLFTSLQRSPLQSGFTSSRLTSDLVRATVPQSTHSVIGAQINNGFSGTTLVLPSELPQTQSSSTINLELLPNPSQSTRNYDFLPNASTGLTTSSSSNASDSRLLSGLEYSRMSQLAPVASSRDILNNSRQRNSSSNVLNTTDDQLVAGANREGNSAGNSLISGANTEGNLDQRSGQPEGSVMNRNYGTESVESTDNSLIELERRVEEACAMVERVLREREEREEFGQEIERKEHEIRAERARRKREREARELQEASRWPQQQEPITGQSQWLCEHYQRHCRVRFPCCTHFFSCHRCHNNSKACDNEEAKASHATHLKCSYCQHEQEIGEDSAKCRSCGAKMSAYFCAICKHFTSIDKNPYHCEKCGICRIHKDKSFHCEVCNVCLDKRLQGKHKCRPDSGHDECCICLEDAFSGCQILPCSHKVHRECAIAMIQNGIRTCPVCRHPLYSPAPD